MEKSTSSPPPLRLVSTATGDSEASWLPPERSPGGGQRGWSPQRYEGFLADTWRRLLLAE